jgi:hypothetical protein
MTLSEPALHRRRRQILDDETQDNAQGASRFNASGRSDASGRPETSHPDIWARDFVDRLAVLVRKVGYKNQA